MKHRYTALAALALLAACGESATEPTSSLASAPAFAVTGVPIANASFEDGYTGWIFTSVDVGPYWTTTDGVNSVDLNGFFPGNISQNIPTVAGEEYTVLFDLAGNPGAPQNVKHLVVSAAGSSSDYYFDTTGKSVTDMGWTEQTFTFTATGASTTLTFTSLTFAANHPERAQGPAVDNVRVTFESGPANPTSADQCKKGGWEQYGFSNQGRCIQYVNTGKDSR